MNDLTEGEVVYVACTCSGKPEVLRVKYLRVVAEPKRKKPRNFTVCNDKGTEMDVPLRFVYKARADAEERAEKMVR